MHYFEYHKRQSDLSKASREKYAWLFEAGLSGESIEARYRLLEYLSSEYSYSGMLEKDASGKPMPVKVSSDGVNQKLVYWSLSHTALYVAFIISDSPVGIDIAEYGERDHSLLTTHTKIEYDILGGRTWENFYTLWTAKEAIIKKSGTILEDISNIHLEKQVGPHEFLFEFSGQKHKIHRIIHDSLTLSYTS